ncbi:MAG: substrate-binding domain-containing protein [Candidatus Bathyarchaeota archaeon]|nr:MAG: substrate-binding domain-containing protein [Candidatus Bathyarchaeota archaeon]
MEKTETFIAALILAAVVSVAGIIVSIKVTAKERLRISTTTSLYDSGLLEAIRNQYETKRSISIQIISRGTGLAVKLAQGGDADMILVHAPSKEFFFLKQGYGVCRKIIAYNFFAIVGPETDPAEIRELTPLEALAKIVEAGRNGQAKWVSRGDESGTHIKEKVLWEAAGFIWENLRSEISWYREASKGMGGALILASERSAYTLTDMGTYLSHSKAGLIALDVLVSEGEELLNVYSVIAVNQTRHPHTNFNGAIDFIKFLVSDEGQQLIGDYGKDDYGQPLFYPAVKLLQENNDPVTDSIKEYAFFNGTECPAEYRGDYLELYG